MSVCMNPMVINLWRKSEIVENDVLFMYSKDKDEQDTLMLIKVGEAFCSIALLLHGCCSWLF